MQVKVRMLAFHSEPDVVRVVEVPDKEALEADDAEILGLIFRYGQNDVQPVEGRCSVSVGDVIEWSGKFYMVRPLGFGEITPEQLAEYARLDRTVRAWSQYARPS